MRAELICNFLYNLPEDDELRRLNGKELLEAAGAALSAVSDMFNPTTASDFCYFPFGQRMCTSGTDRNCCDAVRTLRKASYDIADRAGYCNAVKERHVAGKLQVSDEEARDLLRDNGWSVQEALRKAEAERVAAEEVERRRAAAEAQRVAAKE